MGDLVRWTLTTDEALISCTSFRIVSLILTDMAGSRCWLPFRSKNNQRTWQIPRHGSDAAHLAVDQHNSLNKKVTKHGSSSHPNLKCAADLGVWGYLKTSGFNLVSIL